MISSDLKIIGNISGIPSYTQWSKEKVGASNINSVAMAPGMRDIRLKYRTSTAEYLANKYNYTNTDVVGADPLDFCRWAVTDTSIVERLGNILGLTHAIGRVQIQHPGQMTMLHRDDLAKTYMGHLQESEHYYRVELEREQQDRFMRDHNACGRVLIMLDDWRLGQGFGTEQGFISHWKRGDVLAWDWRIGVHSTFNSGYWPRVLVRVTGMTTDLWWHLMQSNTTFQQSF